MPGSEDIKEQSGEWKVHITTYRQSMRNLVNALLIDSVNGGLPMSHPLN